MTTEELRRRHRELLDQKRAQEELVAAGYGDRLELAMIREELMDINAKLRALSPGHRRVGDRRDVHNVQWKQDSRQYKNWLLKDREDSQDANDHQIMQQAVITSLRILSPRQREILDLYQSGIQIKEIANRFSLSYSTVSRALGRAKKQLREETERFLQQQRLSPRLDLSDPILAKVVLAALTPVQSAYLYLYYSEWLSLREISYLTGTDPSAIVRTIHRALRNIGAVVGYRVTVLENIDALDELAYQIYCEVQNTDTIVPVDRRPKKCRKPCAKTYQDASSSLRLSDRPPVTICTSKGQKIYVRVSNAHKCTSEHGRLLTALLERVKFYNEKPQSVISWLISIFSRLSTGSKSGMRWWKRVFHGENQSSQAQGERSTIYAKEEEKIT